MSSVYIVLISVLVLLFAAVLHILWSVEKAARAVDADPGSTYEVRLVWGGTVRARKKTEAELKRDAENGRIGPIRWRKR